MPWLLDVLHLQLSKHALSIYEGKFAGKNEWLKHGSTRALQRMWRYVELREAQQPSVRNTVGARHQTFLLCSAPSYDEGDDDSTTPHILQDWSIIDIRLNVSCSHCRDCQAHR